MLNIVRSVNIYDKNRKYRHTSMYTREWDAMGLELDRARDGSPEIKIKLPEDVASYETAGLVEFASEIEMNEAEELDKVVSPLVFGKGKTNGIAPLSETGKIPFPYVRITKSSEYPSDTDEESLWLRYPDTTETFPEIVISYEKSYTHYVTGVGIYTSVEFMVSNIGNVDTAVDVYIGNTPIATNVSIGISQEKMLNSGTITGDSGYIIVKKASSDIIYARGYRLWKIGIQKIDIVISDTNYVETFIDNTGTYTSLNYAITNKGDGIIYVNIYLGETLLLENTEIIAGKTYTYNTGIITGSSGKITVYDATSENIYAESMDSFALTFIPSPVIITGQTQYNEFDGVSTTYTGVQYTISNISETYTGAVDVYLGDLVLKSNLIVDPMTTITYNTGRMIDAIGILRIQESSTGNVFYRGTKTWSLSAAQIPTSILQVTDVKATYIIDYDNGILYNGVSCTLHNIGTDIGVYDVYIADRYMSSYTIEVGSSADFDSGTTYGISGRVYVYSNDELVYISERTYSCARDINAPWDGGISTLPGIPKENVENEWLIYTPSQLAKLAEDINAGVDYNGAIFTLMNNLDMNNIVWIPIGTTTYPFRAILEGNNKTISNLKIEMVSFSALFGSIEDAEINDLTISNCNVSGNNFISCLAANARNTCKITSCNVTESVATGTRYVGGMIGYAANANMIISNSKVTNTEITGNESIGGLAGAIASQSTGVSLISSSEYTLTSNKQIIGSSNVGGIVGQGTYINIDRSASNATISAGAANCGGIVGNGDNISVTYPKCNVKISGGANVVGGIIGRATNSSISKSNNINVNIDQCGTYEGAVIGYGISCNIYGINMANITITPIATAANIGGIVGYIEKSEILSCSAVNTISGYYRVGGIAGYTLDTTISNSISTGTIKSTATGDYIGVGGIVGCGELASVYSCCNSSNITSNTEYIGGIVGYMISGNIINVTNDADINTASVIKGSVIGGTKNNTVGDPDITIETVYVKSNIDTIVGENYSEWDGVTKTNNWEAIISSSASGGNSVTYWPMNSNSFNIGILIDGDNRKIDGMLGNSTYLIYY